MPRHAFSLKEITGSASFRRLNAHLFAAGSAVGGLPSPLAESAPVRVRRSEDSGAQEGAAGVGKRGRARRRTTASAPSLRVHFVAFRKPGRELDDDNLRGGLKLLRDAIADWFGLDDSERSIIWHYAQAETRGREGVVVTVDFVDSTRQ